MKELIQIPASVIKYIPSKSCKCCGIIHCAIPEDARPWIEDEGKLIGFFWECLCKSTMFVKVGNL